MRGGEVYDELAMLVFCGMGATSLYDSLALDQVPPTPIKPHAWQPCLACMHACVCRNKCPPHYNPNLDPNPNPIILTL